MIVWGGGDENSDEMNSGGRLTRSGDTWSWSATSQSGVPSARERHTAVWAHGRMLVAGGNGPGETDGGSYDPVSDSWQPIPVAGQPDDAIGYVDRHTAVWTGKPGAPSPSDRMLLWGGRDSRTLSYDPAGAGIWTIIGDVDQRLARTNHSSVWTGTQMLLWGGRESDGAPTRDGARYVAATGDWLPLPTPANADYREHHTAVWTGTEMILWGGINDDGKALQRGARYNPLLGDNGQWTEPSITLGPPRARHEAVWTGDRMIVWGGYRPDTAIWHGTGLELIPGTGNQASSGSILQPPDARTRRFFSLTWAPQRGEVLLWGGLDANGSRGDGWRYNPVTKDSATIPDSGDGRYGHEAVWTGNSLLVVGGVQTSQAADAVAYFPAQAEWTTVGALAEPRIFHSMVWTGTQALVWGGVGATDLLRSGERITPPAAPDLVGTIAPMALTDAPVARMMHTAVWSPERMEMLVWGGEGHAGATLANLGVYSASGVPKPPGVFADGFE